MLYWHTNNVKYNLFCYCSGERVIVSNLNDSIDTYYALNSSIYLYTQFGLSGAPLR